MPAIQRHRLKIQSAELVDLFGSHEDFVVALHTLLDFYADRTRRPGQSGQPPPLIQAYNVPQQVLKEIELALKPKILTKPHEALRLADTLWKQPWLEIRLLAIAILGDLPSNPVDRILRRIENWVSSCFEDRLLDRLLEEGISQVRGEDPELFISLMEGWLLSSDFHLSYVGLRAIPSLLSFSTFDNLPAIFRLITPMVREAPSDLTSELVRVLQTLARRSPQETAYFLQQIIITSNDRKVGLLIRQSLPAFPVRIREDLRKIIRREAGLLSQSE